MASLSALFLRRRLSALLLRRRLSTAVLDADAAIADAPAKPELMPYDVIANEVIKKLRYLDSPDPMFLRYANPVPVLADHSEVLAAPETKVTTLPNGLRIATESSLATQTATVGVWIDAGSRYETDETSGVAHFLEHMVFRGTSGRSMRQLEGEVENMGGHLNAYTGREQTAYFSNGLSRDVPKALEILADILQNSTFDDARINHERNVILTETKEVEKQHGEMLLEHLHATAFQYTPLGRTILGPKENIKKITQNHIRDYISSHYTPSRMVISAAGGVKHEDLVDQVKKLFSKLSSDSTTTSQLIAKNPASFTGSEIRMIDDDMPLAHFAVAFQGAAWTDPDSIALMVMQSMLGSWDKNMGGGKHSGSELVQRIAINDIAESMTAFNTSYKDIGLFGVYVTAKPDCLDDLAFAIMNAISKLCYRVSDEDVTRACNQLKSSFVRDLDGTCGVAKDIGRQLLTYGRRIPLAELFARIDAVDASTVKRVANRFIFDQDVAIAAMGPVQPLPDYNWFRRRTYLLRY